MAAEDPPPDRETTPDQDDDLGADYGDGADWDPTDPAVPDAAGWPVGFSPDDDMFDRTDASAPPRAVTETEGAPAPRTIPGEYHRAPTMPTRDEANELRELERRVEAMRTPAFPIDLRRHLPMRGLWERWRRVAMWGRSDVVDDFGRDPKASARWEPLFELLYSRWFRVKAEGVEHVPSTGRALLVANHAGTLPYDSAMVMHAVRRDHSARRDVRPLIEDAVFHLPFLGPLMNRIGGVRACPENAERLLANDELVAVFPEGVKGMSKLWRDRYRLQRFGRGGFVKLAIRARAPIVPVAVVGAEEATPMMAKVTWFAKNMGLPWLPVTPTFPWLGPAGLLPLPSRWMVQFAAPIDLAADLPPEAAEDRLLVNRIADQIRSQIQGMVDELLVRRGGAYL